ncbi:MAG TPA: hypothetical protein VFL17_18795 [Anaerolineae bacterium]|nr:hypothetical protein [Anaerolineae bacterium]
MISLQITLADLVAGASEERCLGCPPDRVCAWACWQGMGVADNAIAEMLGFPLDEPLDADDEFVRQALCECYT